MEDILDTICKWSSDNHIVTIGLLLLVVAFILSFCFKTFWGEWKR